MEPVITDTMRFSGRTRRNAYWQQRRRLANATASHCSRRPEEAHDADSQLWEAFEYVTRRKPSGLQRPAVRP
jgi:hypothetical protein